MPPGGEWGILRQRVRTPQGGNMGCELLLFDIGNTSVKIGLADARRVVASYTLHTDVGQTARTIWA